MTLKLEVQPQQYEALAIVLRAMNITFVNTEADEAYERKVEDNLLKIMLAYEAEGAAYLTEEKTMQIHNENRQRLGV
jgi:hypothetical protein